MNTISGVPAVFPEFPPGHIYSAEDVATILFSVKQIVKERDMLREANGLLVDHYRAKIDELTPDHLATAQMYADFQNTKEELRIMTEKADKYRVERDQHKQELAARIRSAA